MKKSEQKELDDLFYKMALVFKGICWVCKKPYDVEESWVVHHWEYKEGEKTYDDFRFPDGRKDRLNYYRYLVPLILGMPRKEARRRFRLIHNTHHYEAEMRWAIYKAASFEQMVKLSRNINRRKFPQKS